MKNLFKTLIVLCLWAALTAPAHAVDQTRLVNAAADADNWLSHGRDYAETRFSPLQSIDTDNVSRLGLAWYADLDERSGQQGTPLIVDGVMYLSGSWSRVYAFNASSGKSLWRFDPGVERSRSYAMCCGVMNRGPAVLADRLFIGTLDGYLVALDRHSGKEIWRTLTVDHAHPYAITGAPRVVKGKVIIGNGGAEYGVRGYVSAYDAQSGELAWRFWTVPGNPADGFETPQMEMAAKTWTGQWWKYGGGGTVWDSMSYDPELDMLYIGVGNGGPHNRRIRSPEGGDNLFLSSIVALRPDTGEYLWHYQETPAETWDFTATQHMILADIPWRGEQRKVIMQAPKNGFFFILDRATGELLSAEPYVPVTWASHYDMASGRPVETDNADYEAGPQVVRPMGIGGHNWHPMSYSPDTGLVYIPALDFSMEFEDDSRPFTFHRRHWNIGYNTNPGDGPQLLLQAVLARVLKSYLIAWDPVKQQQAWRIATPKIGNGGILSTAGGLVFQGHSGDQLVAYNASSGETLWDYPVQNGVMASPVTYAVDGEQFVAIQVGRGGGVSQSIGIEHPPSAANDRIMVFKLDAKQALPPIPQPAPLKKPPARIAVTDQQLAQGQDNYSRFCVRCHGSGVVSDGSVPDLRKLDHIWYDNFDKVVRLGMMEQAGMPRFDDVLSEEDVRYLKAYVLEKANEHYDDHSAPAWWQAIKAWYYGLVADLIVAIQ